MQLANPKFSPLSNPADVHVLHGWERRELEFTGVGVFVQVEGDAAPRGFRGQTFGYNFPIVALWPRDQAEACRLFVSMLEDRYQASDARILVEHGDKLGSDILATSIAETHSWHLELRKPAGIYALEFYMTQVV